MHIILLSGGVAVLLFISAVIYNRNVKRYREKMIRTYAFPEGIKAKVLKVYPHLSDDDLNGVMRGLREYFHVINLAGKNRVVAMPSQVIDVAWHEFILFTKEYAYFCKQALGRFIHHTPAEAMESPTGAQAGIKRAWRIACFRENINPLSPAKLPFIFAIDSALAIDDGFTYELDCKKSDDGSGNSGAGASYCATHIGCSSGCSGTAGDGGCTGGGDGGAGGCSGGGCGGS